MKTNSEWARRLAGAVCGALALALLALPGCGGNGTGGVDSGGTGIAKTLAVGPISGFGSVIVAGVHYDEASARVLDDDDQPIAASALTLGATVSIDAGDVTTVGTRLQATAQTVRVSELLVGPIESIDLVGQTLRVLGQAVAVTAGTAFDTRLAGGLAALVPGGVVAIHGQLDPAGNRSVATRIEPRPGAAAWLLRGAVSTFDRVARRLSIGAQVIDFAGLATLPDGLSVGTRVRVKLSTTPVSGLSTATALRTEGAALPDRSNVELDGRVTTFTSAQHFSVDGVPVDASAATTTGGAVTLGARVEVEGRTVTGTLLARRMAIDAQEGGGDQAIELEGRITTLDTRARTFVLRGQTVSYGKSPLFEGGTEADLAANRPVNVKGRWSTDRTQVEATRIHLEL